MDDPELANYPGLYARSGRWYVRKRVPVDLVHVSKRGQVRLSLGTASKRDAISRYPLKMAEIAMVFEDLRRQLREAGKVTGALKVGKLEKLTHREIEGLVTEWWNGRVGFRQPVADDLTDRAEMAAAIMAEAEVVAHPSPEDGDVAGRLADQLLVDAGIAAYRDGQIFVIVPQRELALGPIPLPAFIAHQLGNWEMPDLAELASLRVKAGTLPPRQMPHATESTARP